MVVREAPVMSRRRCLASGAGALVWLANRSTAWPAAVEKRPRVAVLFTVLRFRSHAHHILEALLGPYLFRGAIVEPRCQVVSLYADQFPEDDWSRKVSQQYQIPLYSSIEQALTCGQKTLAVDSVICIGEQGDYPINELGQQLYPRKEFFDHAVAVMRRSQRYVPLFNDKHLSYRWDWAEEMYATARREGFPLLAGSSVPLAERLPALDLPRGVPLQAAVAIHGGGMESYGFHGLELLQSFVESRPGGERGVAQVELLTGPALLRAAEQGRWSRTLAQAALDAADNANFRRRPPHISPAASLSQVDHGILVTYRDGLRAAVLKVGNYANRWNFACQLAGEAQPRATALYSGPWGNRCLFRALTHAIEQMCVDRREPYPAERTLLTTGILEAAMRSHASGKTIETPHLQIAYQPSDWRSLRETGKSWQMLTAETIEPHITASNPARCTKSPWAEMTWR